MTTIYLLISLSTLIGVVRVVVGAAEGSLSALVQGDLFCGAGLLVAVVGLEALGLEGHGTAVKVSYWSGHSFLRILARGAVSDSRRKLMVRSRVRDDLALQQGRTLAGGTEVVGP